MPMGVGLRREASGRRRQQRSDGIAAEADGCRPVTGGIPLGRPGGIFGSPGDEVGAHRMRSRSFGPTLDGAQSVDGLAVVSGVASVKPAQGARIPFDLGDAPFIA